MATTKEKSSTDRQVIGAWVWHIAICTQALISLWVSAEQIARWRQTATTADCSVERRVVMWVRCNIIVLAATARLECFCRRGRVVVVVDCSAVECDDCSSQWPTRDLHCLMTIDEGRWRWRTSVVLWRGRLLHSPTHMHTMATHAHRIISYN